MSGPIDAAEVLDRTETALAPALKQRQPTATGRLLGISHQTFTRWGLNLDAWSVRGWIHLLCDDEPLRIEHVRALTNAPSLAVPGNADRAAFDLLRTLANEMAAIGQRLADSHLDRNELRLTDQELASIQAQVSSMRAVIHRQLEAHP